MRRIAGLLLISWMLVSAVSSGAVSAHGLPLRGQEIDRGTSGAGQTGQCICDRVWYTTGLRPGTFTATAKVVYCDMSVIRECGLRVELIEGSSLVAESQLMCSISRSGCKSLLKLSHRITHKGAYYLLIDGQGAVNITYHLRVRGEFYALHCHRYC